MRAQEKMGHSSMSDGVAQPHQPRAGAGELGDGRGDVRADEPGRRDGRDGQRAHEMMREEARARTTHPEHRWEE
jgi:hypothetical protein